uniref:Cell cycle control protein 50A n=1 Tax=Anopheles atroparvus TaxID=41427 RepID=A0AAG5D783_ANOAO
MSPIEGELRAAAPQRRRRPPDSAFYQQRLPSCNPNWSPRAVWPFPIALGALFISIGLALLHVSSETPEFTLDYTHCLATGDDRSNRSCAEIIHARAGASCKCSMDFRLEQPFPRDVYLYYALTNFHQSHRAFMISRDDGQLRGDVAKVPSPRCHPLTHTVRDNRTLPVAPCGLIANSLFNDTFVLELLDPVHRVPLVGGGSVWPHESRLKFRNPPGDDLRRALQNISRPPAWSRELWELDPANPANNGFQNEDLINWMRSPALPNFRKRHRRVNHSVAPFERGLPRGEYRLNIRYTYPVVSFGGSKSIVLSSPSLMGAKNPFLGQLFLAVGIVKVLIGCVLFAVFYFDKPDAR